MRWPKLRKTIACLTALSLITWPNTATAQSSLSSDFEPGGVVGSSALTALSSYPEQWEHAGTEVLFSSPLMSQAWLNAFLALLSIFGKLEETTYGGRDFVTPYPTVEGIVTPALVSKNMEERAERWVIASPAMKREVEVLVKPQADASKSAPVFYLLDGVNSDTRGDFLYQGDLGQIEDNVTIVMPTGARGSMWTDWQKEDPGLGRHMWETFLTKELPGVIESEVNFNGKRAIGGISMGAGGAVMIANLNPGMYQAVLGISGCYSTLSNIGHETAYLNIHSRGGDLENMWGPFGSPDWVRHDVPSNPTGLAGTRMYISAGSGIPDPDQRDAWIANPVPKAASVLEVGVRTCTQQLDRTMDTFGVDQNAKFVYTDYGSHEWANFNQHFGPGWEYIRPALY